SVSFNNKERNAQCASKIMMSLRKSVKIIKCFTLSYASWFRANHQNGILAGWCVSVRVCVCGCVWMCVCVCDNATAHVPHTITQHQNSHKSLRSATFYTLSATSILIKSKSDAQTNYDSACKPSTITTTQS